MVLSYLIKDRGVRETGTEHNTTLHNTATKRTAQRMMKKIQHPVTFVLSVVYINQLRKIKFLLCEV